jgi:hypothetical protein
MVGYLTCEMLLAKHLSLWRVSCMKLLAMSVISLSNMLFCSLTIDLQTIQTTKSKKNNKWLQQWDDKKDTFQWHKGYTYIELL